MFCTQCGKLTGAGARFCSSCGAAQAPVAHPPLAEGPHPLHAVAGGWAGDWMDQALAEALRLAQSVGSRIRSSAHSLTAIAGRYGNFLLAAALRLAKFLAARAVRLANFLTAAAVRLASWLHIRALGLARSLNPKAIRVANGVQMIAVQVAKRLEAAAVRFARLLQVVALGAERRATALFEFLRRKGERLLARISNQQAAAEGPLFCTRCGHRVGAEDRFCSSCGAAQQVTAAAQQAAGHESTAGRAWIPKTPLAL